MALRLNTAMRNRLADSFGTAFDGGTLELRTGAQPASANNADAGSLLATITLPADSFGAAASGVASKAGTWTDVVDAGGTVAHGRFKSSGGGSLVSDVSVSESGGGGDVIIDDDLLVLNGTVTITAFTVTMPSGE